jgi:thiamine pyrophosphate-dependent acetolactate synthase large subunit-like protein
LANTCDIQVTKIISVTQGLTDVQVYQALAEAFVAEGVDTLFVLTGDGNMHWEVAFAEHEGARSYHVRHEHCACSMAMSYAVSTDKVGVASVTCGPGLTQIMTALATAAQARIPLVVFSGESPMNAAWYNQDIDQAPLVRATGAHYIAAHSLPRVLESVREAFYFARTERRPVVLGVPLDLQKQVIQDSLKYTPSSIFIPDTGRMMPNLEYVEKAVAKIKSAQRVIILGGRGAKRSEAQAECEELADLCGGLLAATLPVRGLFDHSQYSLGVAGGFSHHVAREKFAECDLVIAVGASLTHHTKDGGSLFPNAYIVQIDPFPTGIRQGLKAADLYVRADAKMGLQAIIDNLRHHTCAASDWRHEDLARRMKGPADITVFEIEPDTLDPRDVVTALDRVLPKDWEIVNSSGHCSYFSAQMRGRSAENFLAIREFGAIGNGLSYAIGVAAAKPDKNVVLIDGDGGFLMHVQELETIRRHNLKILICILNDGAYGSEIHKLRSDKLDDHGAMFGRGDLGQLARGFGLRGAVISDLDQLPQALRGFSEGGSAEVWDFHISDQVISPVMRKITGRKSK